MLNLKTVSNNIRRSPYQAFAAIFILIQTFFVISLLAVIIIGSAKVLAYFESKPQVSAYFRDDAKQTEINSLQKNLKATGKIAKINFISKQQALKIYDQQNKNDPLLLELVTPDTLPASFEISTYKIEDLSGIATTLQKNPLVDKVIFQAELISQLKSWTSALRKIGLGLSIIFALDSIFVMVIILSIKISQKKKEIEVMKLIGATNWYISLPFMLEGIAYAVIGAFIGWAFSSVAIFYLSPFLTSFLGDITLSINYLFFLVSLGIELLLAVILGSLSSYIAVSRYLK